LTNNTKTREAHDAYVANRKEAGRVIDIETCEITIFYCNYFNPYGTFPFDDDYPPDDPLEQCKYDSSECLFVRSAESGGWIEEPDLPDEKARALRDRIEREDRLLKAACAAHPLWKADKMYWKWIGDDEAPSHDAMIKWFKVSYPAQAREVEGRAKDQGGDRRIVLWGELIEVPF
jgi:hypothetical protein